MILDFSRWRIRSHDSNYYLYIYILLLKLHFNLPVVNSLSHFPPQVQSKIFLFLTLRFFFFSSSYSIKILLLRKPETFSFLFLFLVAEMFHKYQFFLTLVKIFPLPLGFTQSPYYLSSRKIYCNETRKQFIFDESKCTERKRLII